MVADQKPSVKKKRRLKLIGPDDQYAKRDAVKERSTVTAQDTDKPAANTQHQTIQKETPSQQTVAQEARPEEPKRDKPEKKEKAAPHKVEPVPVNIRLPVGDNLTKRLTELASKHEQPIEPIIKTARKRAAERFKTLILSGNKPETPKSETGGEVTRFAATFSGETAKKINAWFDPFNLGVAKDGIKPIMTALLQEEVAKICDAVE